MQETDTPSSSPECAPPARKRFSQLPAFAVLLIGLLSTAVIAQYVRDQTFKDEQTRFVSAAREIESRIDGHLERYRNMLLQARAFFVAEGDVSRQEFRVYVESLMLLERYPGIQGLGYTERLSPEELDEHITRIRETENPNYDVWPRDPRPEYFSIVFLEPADWRNKRAIGYDMFTEPTRREAMELARDTGLPTLTGKVTLVQETSVAPQAGLLMYVPVYGAGEPTGTIEQRRDALTGFVYGAFRAGDLFNALFANVDPSVDFKVIDPALPSGQDLMYSYDTSPAKSDDDPHFVYRSAIGFDGHGYELVVTSPPGFELAASRGAPIAVAITGLIVSLLIFQIVWTSENYARAERARLLQERARARELQDAVQARDEFLSICSHELKTPLTSMKLQTQLAERRLRGETPEPPTPDRMLQLAESTNRQIDRLNRLVDDMLDVARINTGRMRIEPEELSIAQIIEEVVERFRPEARSVGTRIKLALPEREVRAVWDRLRIDQVISNLVSNAIKYGEGKPVHVSVEATGPSVRITVRDEGPGIAKEDLERIFQRFERATSHYSISGLGLGLYIVQQIVDAHDGTISVESEPGKGATFTVELPLAPPSIVRQAS